MARIRTIKPEFWSSEQVMASRPLARLLFIGIWNFCDDGGNHPLAPRTIKALVFPGDDITTEEVSELLGELEGSELTKSYTVDGKQYLHVNGWKHQKIEKKNFKYPTPPLPVAEESPTHEGAIFEESSNGRRPLDPVRDVDVDLEGKGEDQNNTLSASESNLADVEPEQIENPVPVEEFPLPVDLKAPTEMTLDWEPDQNLLKNYALRMAIPLDTFTPEATATFVCHYAASGRFETQIAWVSLLVKWVKRDTATAAASNVRPFPKPQTPSRHAGFETRDYKAGTKENANGTFRL